MRTQQAEIAKGLHSRFAIAVISHRMGKHSAIGIIPGFTSIFSHDGLCEHFPIERADLAPYHMLRKGILSRIVGTVDKILALKNLKIGKIPHHHHKSAHK